MSEVSHAEDSICLATIQGHTQAASSSPLTPSLPPPAHTHTHTDDTEP